VFDRRVLGAGVRVVQDEMPVRERAPLGVLSGEADRDALDEQAREGERLRLAPIDASLVERFHSPFEHLHELRIDREAIRDADELVLELAQPLGGDARFDRRLG
jgi:hypothetical protein